MKIFIIFVAMLCLAISAFAASLDFRATLPSATQATLGAGRQLEIQKAAITEIRVKMQNWATFSGYSAGTTR